MAKYEIYRWDPVVFGNNTKPFPMIYIKPDDDFITFAAKNNNTVFVKIEGTNTIYDNHAMVGIVTSSGTKPRCTPNFAKDTELITISLYALWYEYPLPNHLGTATISGLKGQWPLANEPTPPFKPPVPITEMYEPSCPSRLTTAQISGIIIGIIVLFGVLLWISLTVRKNNT